MTLHPIVLGLLLLAVAAAIALEASTFPTMAGMAFGPDLFPTIAAAGLALSAFALIVEGVVERGRLARNRGEKAPRALVALKPGVDRESLINMVAILVAIVFFGLALNPLGFHLTAFVVLGVLLLRLRVAWAMALTLAILGPVLIHGVFYSLLRVPLPWGLLTPIAW